MSRLYEFTLSHQLDPVADFLSNDRLHAMKPSQMRLAEMFVDFSGLLGQVVLEILVCLPEQYNYIVSFLFLASGMPC